MTAKLGPARAPVPVRTRKQRERDLERRVAELEGFANGVAEVLTSVRRELTGPRFADVDHLPIDITIRLFTLLLDVGCKREWEAARAFDARQP